MFCASQWIGTAGMLAAVVLANAAVAQTAPGPADGSQLPRQSAATLTRLPGEMNETEFDRKLRICVCGGPGAIERGVARPRPPRLSSRQKQFRRSEEPASLASTGDDSPSVTGLWRKMRNWAASLVGAHPDAALQSR